MAESVDKLWYLKRIHLFRCLDRESLERVNAMAVHGRYQRGQIIFGPDDPGDFIYLLKEGRVKLARFDDRGKEVILAILEEGEFFGEEALVPGERCNGYAEALQPALICRLRTTDFEQLMADHSELALTVARQMSKHLMGARTQIEALAFRDVPTRLAMALIELGEHHGQSQDDGSVRIKLRITHQELASLIASTRETTTALLNRFKRDGLVDVDERWLVLRRPEGLRQVAGLDP